MPNYGNTYTPLTGQPQGQAPNAEQNLLGALLSGAAPQLAQGQLQYNEAAGQLGLVGPQLQNTLNQQSAQAGYQQGQLGLSAQGIGLQQQALGQEAAQQGQQQQFEQQQYALQSGQFPEQYAEAALSYQNALRNTQGAQAIGGTQNTVGGKADISTLGQQYGFQLQDIARSQALSQISQASEVSGYQYSQQQLANAGKNLALSAQANGLSQQQLLTMLQYGQQQSGLGAQQDIISLLGSMGQAAAGNVSNAGQALSSFGFASGLNALAGIG